MASELVNRIQLVDELMNHRAMPIRVTSPVGVQLDNPHDIEVMQLNQNIS